MYSEISYFFSKRIFAFATVFIIAITSGIIYYASLFYPNAWKLSLLIGSPLLVIIYILPEYFRSLYFLFTKKPGLILTKEKLIDNFKNKEYKWTEINKIEYKISEDFGTRGYRYINVYLNDSTVVSLAYAKLKCKRSDLLDMLAYFHNTYK